MVQDATVQAAEGIKVPIIFPTANPMDYNTYLPGEMGKSMQ